MALPCHGLSSLPQSGHDVSVGPSAVREGARWLRVHEVARCGGGLGGPAFERERGLKSTEERSISANLLAPDVADFD